MPMNQPKILIAPCYGNPKSRRRFDTTITQPVDFATGPAVSCLTAADRTALDKLHPEGKAHFWGATGTHARMMAGLGAGDVVLFTGDNKVKAIGEVGHVFQNVPFADVLWRFSDDDASFAFAYSVTNIRHVERPKSDLLSLTGFNPADPLTGQRFVRAELVPAVMAAFDIHSEAVERRLLAGLATRLAEGRSRVVDPERHHTDSFATSSAAKVDLAHRVESGLVLKYRGQCARLRSFVTASGRRADLYREEGDEVEVIEAKSLSTREKVREAVAQLLDYAVHSPKPVTRLSGLFPMAPDQESLDFMARLGIDCVFDDGAGFTRVKAPESRRSYMLPVWRGE